MCNIKFLFSGEIATPSDHALEISSKVTTKSWIKSQSSNIIGLVSSENQKQNRQKKSKISNLEKRIPRFTKGKSINCDFENEFQSCGYTLYKYPTHC